VRTGPRRAQTDPPAGRHGVHHRQRSAPGNLRRLGPRAYQLSDDAIAATERFWSAQGFTIEHLASCWRFEDRETLERVVHLEFPERHVAPFLATLTGLEIDVHLLLIHATF